METYAENTPPSADYDAAKLIAGLGLNQLVELEDILTPPQYQRAPWLEVVQDTREECATRLAILLDTGCPIEVPESPPYDAAREPQHYITSLRQENRQHPALTTGEWNKLYCILRHSHGQGDNFIICKSQAFIQRHRSQIAGYAPNLLPHLRYFLVSSFRNLVMWQLIFAQREYRNSYSQQLQTLGMGALSDKSFQEQGDIPFTIGQLQTAQDALNALPYESPLPNFFAIDSTREQTAIIDTFGQEWLQLYNILQSTGHAHVAKRTSSKSLAYLSVEVLRTAVEDIPHPMRAKVCRAFLDKPLEFEQSVLRNDVAYVKSLTQGVTPSTGIRLSEAQQESRNNSLIAIQKLLEHPLVNPAVLDLVPGSEVALTDADKPIPVKEFDTLIDLHLELLGRALHAAHPLPNPKGVSLPAWHTIDAGMWLRDNLRGTLSNVRIARLPVTEHDLRQHFKNSYDPIKIQPESVAKLLLSVEHKATGKKPATVTLELLLVTSKQTDTADTIKKRGRRRSGTAATLAASLLQESSATARVVEPITDTTPFVLGW